MENELSSYIDHSLLKPIANKTAILTLIEEALAYSFATVCVPPCYVALCAEALKGKSVKVCTVIGFPLGYNHFNAKFEEAKIAVADGADELDMVINQCAMKNGEYDYILDEIKLIKWNFPDKIVKVIVETCNLTLDEKKRIVNVVIDSGADFIKTSTGFSSAGAAIDDIKLFKKIAGKKLKIKASGGIKDLATMKAFIAAGADRIGTSSGVTIIGGSK
ncbi:deoxyribose-phosphate aldolase [Thermodesulfobacteriota bacterium]